METVERFIVGMIVTIGMVLVIPFSAYADITDFEIVVCGSNFPPCADTLTVTSSDSGHWTYYVMDGSGGQQRRDIDVTSAQYTYSWYGGGLPYNLYLYDGDCTGLSRSECETSVGSAGFYTWQDSQSGGTYNFEDETHTAPSGGGTSTTTGTSTWSISTTTPTTAEVLTAFFTLWTVFLTALIAYKILSA